MKEDIYHWGNSQDARMGGAVAVVATSHRVVETVNQTVSDDPLVLAAALLAVLFLLITALAIRWYLGRTPADRLLRTLGKFDDVAIIMHPNPDPDAMGTALGVKEIAAAAGTPATLYYSGQIRHQENRAFRNVLELDLEKLELAEDIEEQGVVLVDHNKPRGFQGAGRITPDVVIDHHPGDGTGSSFTDVREDYGACASIVSEYFDDLEAPFLTNGNGRELTDGGASDADGTPLMRSNIATGLLYGIQSDTNQLTKGCSSAEFTASSYLFPAIDSDKLRRIANPQVTSETLEIKARAIQDRVINGSFAISDVGDVDEIDAIAQSADELIRLEGISAVVVYGSKDGTIHLSGRSDDDRVHMGRVLDAVFEDVPMASAGGHARMGGGQVPIQYLAGIGPSAVDEDRARSDLRGMLFNAMKGNV